MLQSLKGKTKGIMKGFQSILHKGQENDYF